MSVIVMFDKARLLSIKFISNSTLDEQNHPIPLFPSLTSDRIYDLILSVWEFSRFVKKTLSLLGFPEKSVFYDVITNLIYFLISLVSIYAVGLRPNHVEIAVFVQSP